MMRARRVITALLFSMSFAPALAGAQSSVSGTIAGVVKDTSGAILPGVTVEASSPALIEKVRSVVSDDRGEYKIIDLRPGTYTITFTLSGFNVTRREGIELTSGFTASVNAELKVGSLEETITVTGASPVVDTQSVRTQRVYQRDVLDALPFSKTFAAYTTMTPGVSGGATGGVITRDVGGTQGEAPIGLSAHGSDPGMTSIDGIKTVSVLTANVRRLNISDQYTQEVVLETSGASAEAWSGGVNINVVPKDGGNTFRGTTQAAYTGKGLDSNNLNDDLRARGLVAYNEQKKLWDFGVGFGGPVKKDKLWFYVAPRTWGNEYYVAGNYFNLTPHTLFYTPDLSRPAIFGREQWDVSGRLTWQAAASHKITLMSINSYQCFCPFAVEGGGVSPEAATIYEYKPQKLASVTWSHPATNRLLFEAGAAWRNEGVNSQPDETLTSRSDIPVLETSINRRYGSHFASVGPTDYGTSPAEHWLTRGSVSYVTGSHALKAGFTTFSAFEILSELPSFPYSYTFRNQLPTAVVQVAVPHIQEGRIAALGLFVQDQWTIRQLTINAGLRFDRSHGYSPAQTRPGGAYVAAIDFPKVDNIPNWKDINPRVGLAYNVFGNGKTAIKGSIGRYELNSNFSLGFTRSTSPLATLVVRSDRAWNDNTFPAGDPRNGNFVADCDLTNRLANGECGALNNQSFGTTIVNTRWADDVKEGWGNSPHLWQSALALQQELRSNVALTVGYYRTWYGNITVTDNLAVTPADFTPYCLTAPQDSRLLDGGGYQVCGLFDVSREKFGRVDNLVTLAPDRSQVYNGFDVLLNARLGSGIRVNGGLATGQTVTDNCSTPDVAPQYCKQTNPWSGQTEIKFSVVYPLPWYGVQVSAAVQNLPGLPRQASLVATNAQIAPALGRNLAACPSPTGACTGTAIVRLDEPFTLLEPRGNQVDTRLSKIFRMGRYRLQGNFDAYNLFNSGDVLTLNTSYGSTWLRPVSILTGRLIKFSGQFDF